VQRGRKTTANVVALNVSGLPPRLTAPSHLNKAERTLFNELVGSCDPRHFVKSDLPLLTSFVQATILTRSTATKLGRNNPDAVAAWEKAVRVMALLATRLRLAPQARSDPKTVGIRQRNAELGVAPWHRGGMDDDW
jgi:hypothetical protein